MARSEQGSVVREIRLLRSRWRGLETESRLGLHGHERGDPGYRQGHDLTEHRASPRPYRVGRLNREHTARPVSGETGSYTRLRTPNAMSPRPSRNAVEGSGTPVAMSEML